MGQYRLINLEGLGGFKESMKYLDDLLSEFLSNVFEKELQKDTQENTT